MEGQGTKLGLSVSQLICMRACSQSSNQPGIRSYNEIDSSIIMYNNGVVKLLRSISPALCVFVFFFVFFFFFFWLGFITGLEILSSLLFFCSHLLHDTVADIAYWMDSDVPSLLRIVGNPP